MIYIIDYLNQTNSPIQFIHDKESGQRFPLTKEESDLLTFFGDRLGRYVALEKKTRTELTDRSFDKVSMIFLDVRNGNKESYEEMINWSTHEWDEWIASNLSEIKDP